MANRDRDSMENQGNAGAGILGGLLLLAIGSAVSQGSKQKKKQELTNQLESVRAQLNSYRNKPFSSLFYSTEIEGLEKKEKVILQELSQLG